MPKPLVDINEELRIDAKVDLELLSTDACAALLPFLQHLPEWKQANQSNTSVEQLSGAMTNLIFKCAFELDGKERPALVRVHASKSDLFDRHGEIATFHAVSQAGVGPRLLLLFGNGRIEQFLSDYVTLTSAQMKQPAVSAGIAQAMAAFHYQLSAALETSPYHQETHQVWPRMRQWCDMALQLWPAGEQLHAVLLQLQQQIDELERHLTSEHSCGVALSHNDLQYGNIMMLRWWSPAAAAAAGVQQKQAGSAAGSDVSHTSDQDASSNGAPAAAAAAAAAAVIRLIDYEYSGFNPVAFDIANHWCEWAADYHTDTPHLMDFSKLPSGQERQAYVRQYLTALLACLGVHVEQQQEQQQGEVQAAAACSSGRLSLRDWVQGYMPSSSASSSNGCWGTDDSDSDAEAPANSKSGFKRVMTQSGFGAMTSSLVAASEAYLAVSHLHWALWGFIQAKVSDVDFDFLGYADQRLQQLRLS